MAPERLAVDRRHHRRVVVGVLILLVSVTLPAAPVWAAPLTFTVNVTDDLDGKCTASHCSLRQAIEAANKNPGRDLIRFLIPGSVTPHTIRPAKELPPIKEAVVIDGTTEPDFATVGGPVVELDGSNAPAAAVGLRISGGGSLIKGLIINRFGLRGSSTGGGSGIVLEKLGGNAIEGNYIGTDATGHIKRGNRFAAISIQKSSDNVIGGLTAASRNVLSGNGYGLGISGEGGVATRNTVMGNFIGVDAEGDNPLGNDTGVLISQAAANTIGGTTPQAANVISGNAGAGVSIGGTGSQRNVIQGNLIGTDAAGTANFGNFRGVFFTSGAFDNTIGGTDAGAGNVIAFNSETGIHVPDTSAGRSIRIRILGNSIHSNGIPGLSGLGIELTPGGVNPNDTGDGDLGANRKMNFPVLQSAFGSPGTTIGGSLNSEANATFRLEFFVNPTCDPTGYGEGKVYLGATSVMTNASGNASFTFSSPTPTVSGWFATATSIENAFGNSSEFSACRRVDDPPDPPSWIVTTVADETDSSGCTVSHCSLREAMVRANAVPGLNTISFNIPLGTQPAEYQFSPNTPLPVVTDPVVIDGTTQPDYPGSPVIRIDGGATGAGPVGLQLAGPGDSELTGLSITRWAQVAVHLQSPGNFLYGNWIGQAYIGGNAGSNGTGVLIESGGNQIGGVGPTDGNRIRDHFNRQIVIRGAEADDNSIVGNHIGVEAGEVDFSDSIGGVLIQNGADRTRVGLPEPGGGNQILVRAFSAVELDDVSDTVIQNNVVDRVTQGAPEGVRIDGGSGTLVGGSGALEANTFRDLGGGVLVVAGTGHTIIGNSFFDVGGQAIDLVPLGVTFNDPGDLDDGPNGLQNYPDLSSAEAVDGQTTVHGLLRSRADGAYRIDFYASDVCQGSNPHLDPTIVYGGMQRWLGHEDVGTDGGGDASFTFSTTSAEVGEGDHIVATATDLDDGSTSEGSACAPVLGEFVEADGTSFTLSDDPWYLYGASMYHVSVPGGSGDLDQAMDWAHEAGLNTIRLVNELDERGIFADAPYAETDWQRVDAMLARLDAEGLHAILDLSVFRNHLVNKAIIDEGWTVNCQPNGDRDPVDYAALSPYRADLADEWQRWMEFVSRRINTVTGMRYRDDPTIALVSIAGEPGPPNSEECGMAASTQELTDFYDRTMTAYQALDGNHLVSNGGFLHLDWEERYGNPFGSGIDWQAIFSLQANDVPSIHTYVTYPVPPDSPPEPFTEYQTAKIAPFVANLNKPWITEEFGFPQRDGDDARAVYYQDVYELQQSYGSAGVGFWNLGHEIGPGTFDVNPDTPMVWQVVQDNSPVLP